MASREEIEYQAVDRYDVICKKCGAKVLYVTGRDMTVRIEPCANCLKDEYWKGRSDGYRECEDEHFERAIIDIWRADHKGNDIEDLRKAIRYLEYEIERRQCGAKRL